MVTEFAGLAVPADVQGRRINGEIAGKNAKLLHRLLYGGIQRFQFDPFRRFSKKKEGTRGWTGAGLLPKNVAGEAQSQLVRRRRRGRSNGEMGLPLPAGRTLDRIAFGNKIARDDGGASIFIA
jgi:hypothetical protein